MGSLPFTLGGYVASTATTLAAITTAARERADMVNTTFISATEWTAMVNASCQELYEKLVEAYGNDYEMSDPFDITTDGVSDRYLLPADFFKLLGVDLQLSEAGSSTSGWITLRRFNFADRNRFTLPNVASLWGRTNLRYRLAGTEVWFSPLPSAGLSLRLWYVPRCPILVNPGDSFDGINGWEEWIVNDVAMKARIKEESPINDIQAMQAGQNERLASIPENRDAGSPATTVDVHRSNGYWGGGGWDMGEW
jgi:hypothetical protein